MNQQNENNVPGPVVLFGSGETSPSGRRVFDLVLRKLKNSPNVALIETPAGFELNSARVIGRIGEFLEHRLQNYHPDVHVIPARARGTPFSPDISEIVMPILEADLIFMGPGSPTYAVRQLRDSLAWQVLLARHRLGAALALASAATIAISTWALPVYEIYKVGEDLHWKPGLDFFGLYGLPLVFIPHWNNNDGGDELDTSRCFMGESRFVRLMELLPPDLTVVGIDEKTALILDIKSGDGQVLGEGGVTLIHTGHHHARHTVQPELLGSEIVDVALQRQGHAHYYSRGQVFPLSECYPFEIPGFSMGLSDDVWRQALATQERLLAAQNEEEKPSLSDAIPPEVAALLEARLDARNRKDWAQADAIRNEISALGWQVKDTPQGPIVERS